MSLILEQVRLRDLTFSQSFKIMCISSYKKYNDRNKLVS